MFPPLHLGFEHPNVLWIAATGLLAFVVGLVVNLYRSPDDAPDAELRGPDEDPE
ncbi:hypothetical protein M0R89_02500 [Halorussus limi]|uniref:Uncharacterized protein n=1 Tax=Halorussus limi TaxID=2938695 RepID=A0A8U0HV17_9EURY|nr:hypothetical protein [Halorussus limi]UPV74945.1 hypothetical protein M0R89_02500 [Halorussus limi]